MQVCDWEWDVPLCQSPSTAATSLKPESGRHRHSPPGGKPLLLDPPN